MRTLPAPERQKSRAAPRVAADGAPPVDRRTFMRLLLAGGAVAGTILRPGDPSIAWAEGGETISVAAQLAEIPSKFPPDDLYDYAYVMRYEVTAGALDKGSSILVAHYKPRQPRAKIKDKMKDYVGGKLRSFTVGDVHKMKLSADLKKIWKGPLVDEFAATDHKSVRYWCLEVDPA